MTVQDILTESARLGVRLEARGGRLRYGAPRGVLTSDLRAALQAQKSILLAVVWRLEAMRTNASHCCVAVARLDATGGPGRCFSCGDALDHHRQQ